MIDVAALDLALDRAAGPHANERVGADGDELFERAGGGGAAGSGRAGRDGAAVRQAPGERDVLALDRDLPRLGPALGDERDARGIAGQEHVAGDVTRAAADVVLNAVLLGPARAGGPGRHVESLSRTEARVVSRVDGITEDRADILVAEPAGSHQRHRSLDGGKDRHRSGGLAGALHTETVGVAFAPDGDVIVVHRVTGLIRVNPVTESQSILSQGGLFRDPWAIAIDKSRATSTSPTAATTMTGPRSTKRARSFEWIPCPASSSSSRRETHATSFPANAACQNTTSAGSYLAHPYGIAIDYSTVPATLVVADMSSFNGKGAIIRIQAVPNGAQTLVWGPATASPPPQVAQSSPLGMSDGCRRRAQRQHPDYDLHVPGPVDSDCPSSSRDILRMCCAGDLSTGSDEQRSSGREHQRPAVAARSRVCRWRRHSRPALERTSIES